MSAPAVGIDLGTTNSVVAVSMGGRPQVLTDASGQPLIPSVVSFPEDGSRLVGRPARVRRPLDPANTIYSVKRLLGRAYKSEEVRRARSRMAFDLREGPESAVVVKTRGGEHTLPEISAIVLREVRRVAEEALQEKIEKCVVTVPANFNELQRSSTKAAGRIAELDVVRILNEPTAAALAYGYGRGTREKICIFDFGGGTFDVTLLELAGNVFEVLATAGDTFLGGDDIDIALTDSLLTQFQRATKADALQDRTLYDVLRDSVEQAKCELSSADTAQVNFNFAPQGRGPLKFSHTLTRADMEKVSAPYVTRTFDVCTEALKLANMRATDLTAVILVGGSTRIPSVRSRVASFFGRDPLTNLPPEEVVALGASILAEALTGGARRVNTRPIAPGAQANQSVRPPAGPAAAAVVGAGDARESGRSTLSGGNAPSGRTAQGVAAPNPPPRQAPNAAPNAPAIPQGPNATFDLDDPFADKPTQTMQEPAGFIAGKAKDSDMMWRPLPASPEGAIGKLDEPSFMGRLPGRDGSSPGTRLPTSEGSNPGARIARPEPSSPGMKIDQGEERTVQVPAFNLEDPSFMGPLPTKPTVKRSDSTPGMSAVDDPFATVFTGPGPGTSSGSFQAVTPNASPSGSYQSVSGPSQGGVNDVSIPAFNLSADELFGEPAGPVSKPSSGSLPGVQSPAPPTPGAGVSTVRQNPPTPGANTVRQAPPEMPSGNMTQKMNAVAPPVPGRPPASNLQVPPGLPPVPGRAPNQPPRAAPPPTTNSQSGPLPLPPAPPGQRPQAPAPTQSLAPPPASAIGAPLLLDVTPFSLGVETAGGLCESVIRRNATIPVEQTRVFATTNDGQESVIIRIAQGESRRFQDNQSLGELELTGLREAARGEVAIAVTFELEADGTLKVRARDVESGREQAIRVTLLTVPSETQQSEMAARNRPAAAP